MDLKCRKTTCKYNNYYTCIAKSIAIANELECRSFVLEPSKQVKDASRCLFEEAPTYAPYREKKGTRVACAAKCLFNEQGVCVANGLTVNSVKDIPCCITHINP